MHIIFTMATINNAQLIKNLIDTAKINISAERVPSQLAEKIVPVLEVKPQPQIKLSALTLSDATTGTMFTTHATKRTFVIAAAISTTKDAISNAHFSGIGVNAFGKSALLLVGIQFEPLTAQSNLSQVISLPFPIELEKNTIVNVYNSSATASIDTQGVVYYYEED